MYGCFRITVCTTPLIYLNAGHLLLMSTSINESEKTTMSKENRNNRGAFINCPNAEINFNKSLVAQNVFVSQTQDIDTNVTVCVSHLLQQSECACVNNQSKHKVGEKTLSHTETQSLWPLRRHSFI